MTEEPKESKIYELGYLLTPLIASEGVGDVIDREIRQPVVERGGEVIRENLPRLIGLAYPIKKLIEHKGVVFKDAYFGSLFFRCPPDRIDELAVGFGANGNFMRFLIVRYPRLESTKPKVKPFAFKPVSKRPPDGDRKGESAAAAGLVKREAIDREIEELLAPIQSK